LDPSHRTLPADKARLDVPCPFAVQSAAFTPRNRLVACCGFEISDGSILDFGDVRHPEGVGNALSAANDDLLVAAISLLGPKYLMDKAKEKDRCLNFREAYASICEVCEHVVSRPEVVNVLCEHSGEIAADVLAHPLMNAKMAALR
jgi:hypothetical protein